MCRELFLGVIGVSFRETPLDALGRIHMSPTQKMAFYACAQEEPGDECVILSTCNRTEIYYAGTDSAVRARMRERFFCLFGAARETAYEMQGREALVHLFRVAAGLESLVLGEDQILGQIREAHECAMREQESGKRMNRIFLGAVTAAKRIKTEFGISSIPLSVSYIGIKLLRDRCGVKGRTALVLGAGKMSRLAAQYLLEDGAEKIFVCVRTPRGGLDGLEDGRIETRAFRERYDLIAQSDFVVSATSAPHTVLEAGRMQPRRKPLWILDLALPYDVDPALAAEEGVELWNMETLKQISQRNTRRREELCRQAQASLEEMADSLMLELGRMKAAPVIERLMERCDIITEDAMRSLAGSLALSERESAVVRRVLHASLKKMVREPVRALRRLEEGDIESGVAAAEYLFGLRGTL